MNFLQRQEKKLAVQSEGVITILYNLERKNMLAQKFEIQAASATQETASMHSGEGTHLFTSASEPFGPMQA